MPTTEADIQDVQAKRKAASSKISEARNLEGATYTLQDNIMEAVRADRVERGVGQLATDVGNVMGQMVTDPVGIRERAGDMVNPTSVDYYTSRARAQNLQTLGTTATQSEANYGTLSEIIQAGANQLKARAAGKIAEAERESAEADALMEQLRYQFDVRKQDFYEKMQNEELALAQAKLAASGKGGKGGAGEGLTETEGSKDFSQRAKSWLDSALKLNVINDENYSDYEDDLAGLNEAVMAGEMSSDEAMAMLHETYWPAEGVDVRADPYAAVSGAFDYAGEALSDPNKVLQSISAPYEKDSGLFSAIRNFFSGPKQNQTLDPTLQTKRPTNQTRRP